MSIAKVDVLLVGAGVMSSTLATLLTQLDPSLSILMVERLDQVAHESSDGWNNAGTGHAGYCELNYTPQQANGHIDIQRALAINAAFETSLQLWSHLVRQGRLPEPASFINRTPHQSLVWGKADVDFLRRRHQALSAHHLFQDMQYSEDAIQIQAWMPLAMQGRDACQPVAATRVEYGSDVDFGTLTRHLVRGLQDQTQFELRLGTSVRSLRKHADGRWHVHLHDRASRRMHTVEAGFVFLGAGGGALPLLQKSGIPESHGYGGFPVSGQWLVCRNPEVVARHDSKVYGKAPLGAPPMSVPHLDMRIIDGEPALLFGPYAGFTTKFQKKGSVFDLLSSISRNNLKPVMLAGLGNMDLTRYLIGEVFQSHQARVKALRQFYPQASAADWRLADAGKRVQIIKYCGNKGGKLEFGTEIVAAADGSLAALLGASPGASTSVQAMLEVLQRCFAARMQSEDWRHKLQQMLPGYGHVLQQETQLAGEIRAQVLGTLGLGGR